MERLFYGSTCVEGITNPVKISLGRAPCPSFLRKREFNQWPETLRDLCGLTAGANVTAATPDDDFLNGCFALVAGFLPTAEDPMAIISATVSLLFELSGMG